MSWFVVTFDCVLEEFSLTCRFEGRSNARTLVGTAGCRRQLGVGLEVVRGYGRFQSSG